MPALDPLATGLVALLVLVGAGGLPARLAVASGLDARLPMAAFCFGILGLVARCATIECPPKAAMGTGDSFRDAVPDGAGITRWGVLFSAGAGVCELGLVFDCG